MTQASAHQSPAPTGLPANQQLYGAQGWEFPAAMLSATQKFTLIYHLH